MTYKRIRFVIVMTRSDTWRDGEVTQALFQKIDEAENDPDELAYHRCLEGVAELVISACKGRMHELASVTEISHDMIQSLEQFRHPVTF